MDKLTIEPYIGIDKVKLGMSRKEVHAIMGKDFFTNKVGNTETDCYYVGSFRVNYDSNNVVNYIELADSITDFCQVIFDKMDVFNTPAKELVPHMEKFSKYKDDDDAELGYSYKFEDVGISFWRANIFKEEILQEDWFQQLTQERKEEELRRQYFESVSVWTKGYYDTLLI